MKHIYILLTFIAFPLILISDSNDRKNIELIGTWQDSTLIHPDTLENGELNPDYHDHGSHQHLEGLYNEAWGYASGGREYAILGSLKGIYLIDITDPSKPAKVGYIKGLGDGGIQRDFHTYKHYLYMVADVSPASLMIADLSYLPDTVKIVYASDELFDKAHNIFIDTVSARLYATNDGGIYSLENPELPELIGKLPAPMGLRHDFFVRGDTVYTHHYFGEDEGLHIFDARNPEDIRLISTITDYPFKGISHSGWLSADGKTYIMSDEHSGAEMKLFDISDIENPVLISTFGSGVDSLSIPHNQIIMGDYLFVAYYHDGLFIFNIRNPEEPEVAGFYDTYLADYSINYQGAWGVYPFLPSGNVLVSDRQTGLYVFDVSDATSQVSVNSSQDNPEIKLFPNPLNNLLQIEFPGDEIPKDFTLELISISGQKIAEYEIKNNNSQIFSQDISDANIPRGFFIVRIMSENKTWVITAFH